MECQAQCHDMCTVSAEFQGRSVFGQGKQIHAEKIHREFTIDVVQLIFIFFRNLRPGPVYQPF